MSKEIIAVDVDEVLFPFVEEFVKHDNAIHGGQFTAAQFSTYAFENVLQTTMHDSMTRVYDFNRIDHSHIEPLEQARQALITLSEQFDLAIVTARHPQFEANTSSWLSRHLDGFFTSLSHIGYSPVMEKPVKKVDVCQELGAIALIDDSISHVSECAQEGLEGILFGNYPWNQADRLPSGVVRCLDWPAVLEHFDGRS